MASGVGPTNRRPAKLLSISDNTPRNHLASIYDKLEVSNGLELLGYAIDHGLE